MANKSNYSLWIGNIPFDVTERELHEILSKVGQVVSVRIKYDVDKNISKGFAFCEYKDVETCMLALKYINGYELKGRKLRLYWANEEFKEKLASGAISGFGSGGLLSRGRANEHVGKRSGMGLPPLNKGSGKFDTPMDSNSHYNRKGKGQQLPHSTNTQRNIKDEPCHNRNSETSIYNESNMKKVLISNLIHTLTTSQIMCILSFFKKHAMENPGMMKFYFQRHKNVAYALLHCLFLMNVINEYTMAKNDLHIMISDEALVNKAERMTQMRRSGKLKIGLGGDVQDGGMKHTEGEEQEEDYSLYQRHNPSLLSHVKSNRRGKLAVENVNCDFSEDNPMGGSTYGGPASHVLNVKDNPPYVGGSAGGKTKPKRGGGTTTTTPGLYASTNKKLSTFGNGKGGISNGEETEEYAGREVKYGGRADQLGVNNSLYPEGNSHTGSNMKQRRKGRMMKELYASAAGSGTSQTYRSNFEQLPDGRYNDNNVGVNAGGSQLNNNNEGSEFKLNYASDYGQFDTSMGINHAVRVGGGDMNNLVGHADRRYNVSRGGGSDVGNDEGGLTGLNKCKGGERVVHPFDKASTERSELDMRSDMQDMVSDVNGQGKPPYSVNYVEVDGRSGNSNGLIYAEKKKKPNRQGVYGSSGSYVGRGVEGDVSVGSAMQGPPNESVLSDPTYANVELPDDELVNEVVKNRDILNNILKSRVEDMKSWSTEQRVQVLSIQKALQLKGYALH
ncbi:hypothetical protein AK88_03596 [Plasmodium fragile]|uniref:RRM domain-containing protein n=1 Tax=Plasmodium fragile TaxID=5857 RepID=A0A0D9QJ13_PLAFR|nr:uncharacterized protein AK88_03596 [Plasmodium fragile]KJP86782.1 hypothetical protein AK88_03596 [Plasmodium fragile]